MIAQALILAGGLGTRFRAVSADTPKALAEVEGKPIVQRQVEALQGAGVRTVVLCVGHLAQAVEGFFGDGARFGVRIVYSRERELLGTAGAMLHARPLLAPGPFFAMNGDSIVEGLDYGALGAAHARAADDRAAATLVVIGAPDAGAYGSLELDAPGERLVAFREKAPLRAGAPINAGVYVLEPRVFDFVPAGRAVSIEHETFPACLRAGLTLRAFRAKGFFGDIGTPEGYSRVRERLGGRGQGERP